MVTCTYFMISNIHKVYCNRLFLSNYILILLLTNLLVNATLMFLCHAKVNSRPPPARPAHYWTVALGRCLKGATTSKSTSLACWWKFCFKTEPVKNYFKKNYNLKLYWNNIANYFFVSPSDCLTILKRLHNNGKYDLTI